MPLDDRPLTEQERDNLRRVEGSTSDLALVHLTDTGHGKAIMDATEEVRRVLAKLGMHDYSHQGKGARHRVINPCLYVGRNGVIETKVSMYRPETKEGDPRFWVYGMAAETVGDSILAVTALHEALVVVNLTDGQLSLPQAVDVFGRIRAKSNAVADELLDRLRTLAAAGPIPTVGHGDTAVGRSLEAALGIRMNSSKSPDYKGIEIKSFRAGRDNRRTLFAKVPDWSMSPVKSFEDFREGFGYRSRDGVLVYHNTIAAGKPNSQGLFLKVINDQLHEAHVERGLVFLWHLLDLREALSVKHRETFWVSVSSTIDTSGHEAFTLTSVEHTAKPIVAAIEPLFLARQMTVDHVISDTRGRAHERGPLFKVNSAGAALLFPPSRHYSL